MKKSCATLTRESDGSTSFFMDELDPMDVARLSHAFNAKIVKEHLDDKRHYLSIDFQLSNVSMMFFSKDIKTGVSP